MPKYNLLTILGHTAGGKTSMAAHAALKLNGEVISADSRQVYRGMNLGTGKDYDDYIVEGIKVPAHLIDIVDAGYEYNVYEFTRDFFRVYQDISARERLAVLCGGTGLYLESVLRSYQMIRVPKNEKLRAELKNLDLDQLKQILASYGPLHNKTDIENKKRALRAIEIAEYTSEHRLDEEKRPELIPLVFGLRFERQERRRRITERLHQRLKEGMLDEVRDLLEQGITVEKLEYYGLEYKFLSQYISGKLEYDEMLSALNTAIHRYAKRQMTYFRGMERRGIKIHWLEGEWPMQERIDRIVEWFRAT